MSEEAARDHALDAVLNNTPVGWKEQVREFVKSLPVMKLRAEEIRLMCIKRGLVPHHHNAWGGMTTSLVKDGYLEPIPDCYEAMQAKGSHARKTQVYQTKPPVI